MLTAQQIATLRDAAYQIADPINAYLLQDIARRISEAGQLTSTAQYQVWRAQRLGKSQKEVERELRKLLQMSRKQIRRILHQSAQSGYSLDINRFPTSAAIPFEKNAVLQQIVSAAAKLADDEFTNIVQTIGFVDPYGKPEPLTRAYITSCDFAFQQVVTGAASYTQAIREATRYLAAKGVRVVDYESGVHTSLEAAVRRNILGGLGLMQEQVSQTVHDQLGCDGWEISAHANSAPDHEPIQGKQYPDAAYRALNDSLRRRIGTLNCGHTAFPIILGVNRPQYSPQELEQFRADNEKGVTVEGRHYTGYEATQMQRELERTIRAQKRRVMVDEAAGDQEKLAQDKTRLNILHHRYWEFSKAAGLRTQYERTEVAGFGERPKTVSQMVKPLDKSVETATIPTERASEVPGVRKVCDLDIEKYKCVTPDIQTSEVIVTDERIKHIQERHPEDFERYSGYLKEIVEKPDYIIEDTRPNTAMVLKQIEEQGEHFRVALRLVTPTDNPGYKNSIITFMKIREKEWRRLLRNKKILYKSE